MGRTDQSDRYRNPAITAEWKWPKTASPDGASKSESFSLTIPSDPGTAVARITTVSLSIQRLTDDNMEEAIQGMAGAKGEHK